MGGLVLYTRGESQSNALLFLQHFAALSIQLSLSARFKFSSSNIVCIKRSQANLHSTVRYIEGMKISTRAYSIEVENV
jgi:hypothetical protein